MVCSGNLREAHLLTNASTQLPARKCRTPTCLQASRASATSHASAASGSTNHPRSSGIVGTAAWELRFSDLTFLRPVGEGSFAKVCIACARCVSLVHQCA